MVYDGKWVMWMIDSWRSVVSVEWLDAVFSGLRWRCWDEVTHLLCSSAAARRQTLRGRRTGKHAVCQERQLSRYVTLSCPGGSSSPSPTTQVCCNLCLQYKAGDALINFSERQGFDGVLCNPWPLLLPKMNRSEWNMCVTRVTFFFHAACTKFHNNLRYKKTP